MTEEQKKRLERLELLSKRIDQSFIKNGLTPPKMVCKKGVPPQIHVRYANQSSTPISKPELTPPAEDLIKNMSQQEFRQRAIKALMEDYGYTLQQAQAAVDNPF